MKAKTKDEQIIAVINLLVPYFQMNLYWVGKDNVEMYKECIKLENLISTLVPTKETLKISNKFKRYRKLIISDVKRMLTDGHHDCGDSYNEILMHYHETN